MSRLSAIGSARCCLRQDWRFSAGPSVPFGYQQVADATISSEVLYAAPDGIRPSGRRNTGTFALALDAERPGQGALLTSRREAKRPAGPSTPGGRRSIDIGLMQVNWRYHQQRLGVRSGRSIPITTCRVAAQILRDCHQSRHDWWAAVGCYHAPNSPQRADRYRARVRAHWQRLT